MNRIELFEKAKVAMAELLAEFPEAEAATSVSNQLDYLISLENGSESDRGRLAEIIIGVLVAREIEPRSDEAADLLYQVVDEVDRMKRESV